jgi:Bacterial archaeo-eukaryotic release factor family 3
MEVTKEPLLVELSGAHKDPCVSIYLPTSHGKIACVESMIRFKNLRKSLFQRLRQSYDEDLIYRLMAPLRKVGYDAGFWMRQTSGVAFFVSPGYFKTVRARGSFEESTMISDRFQIKPLILDLQGAGQFFVLAMSLNRVRLMTGDRYGLRDIVLPDPTLCFADFTGVAQRDRHMGSVSIGGGSASSGRRSGVLFHNYDHVSAKRKKDIERYFSAVDSVVRTIVMDSVRQPIVLAALPEHQCVFRAQSKMIGLAQEGIRHNPDAMSLLEMAREAGKIIESSGKNPVRESEKEYLDAREYGRASDRLRDISRALSRGRVQKLILEQERRIPGRMGDDSGRISRADARDPYVSDLLDDFANAATAHAGSVVVLPKNKMPTDTGAAAIFRY